jgi:predicted nuclease of predicted toxin-antitoxin system
MKLLFDQSLSARLCSRLADLFPDSSQLGSAVIPLLLRELQRDPDYWFTAMEALSGKDPAQQNHSFDEVVAAWLH